MHMQGQKGKKYTKKSRFIVLILRREQQMLCCLGRPKKLRALNKNSIPINITLNKSTPPGRNPVSAPGSVYTGIYWVSCTPGEKGGDSNDFHIPPGYSPFQTHPRAPFQTPAAEFKLWAGNCCNGVFSCSLLSLKLVVAEWTLGGTERSNFKCSKHETEKSLEQGSDFFQKWRDTQNFE